MVLLWTSASGITDMQGYVSPRPLSPAECSADGTDPSLLQIPSAE